MKKISFLVVAVVLGFTWNVQASPTSLTCGIVHSFNDNAPMDTGTLVKSPITNGSAKVNLKYKDMYTYELVYTQSTGNLSDTFSMPAYNVTLTTDIKDFGIALNGYYAPIYDAADNSNILHCVLE